MKKILFIFGTRPEAIKMAPLIKELQNNAFKFDIKICITAQHREMLDQVLLFFEIKPDYDLNLMRPGQNLYQLTADIVIRLKPVLENFKPDIVLVHGDTTTSTFGALAAFYANIKIGHIEAGLRTYNKFSPFPEEINRQLTSRLADYHFAPTQSSMNNLLKENINKDNIIVTGNTVIDALLWTQKKLLNYNSDELNELKKIIDSNKKIILVTGHRRENFGEGFINICQSLKQIALDNKYIQIIYPVHLNPNVQEPVFKILNNISNINLIKPLSYPSFIWLMMQSYLILTDSGGVQEEAPSLKKPVLVMRKTTERPEAVNANIIKIIGTSQDEIVSNVSLLLNNPVLYNKMSIGYNPYGDGKACKRIIQKLISL